MFGKHAKIWHVCLESDVAEFLFNWDERIRFEVLTLFDALCALLTQIPLSAAGHSAWCILRLWLVQPSICQLQGLFDCRVAWSMTSMGAWRCIALCTGFGVSGHDTAVNCNGCGSGRRSCKQGMMVWRFWRLVALTQSFSWVFLLGLCFGPLICHVRPVRSVRWWHWTSASRCWNRPAVNQLANPKIKASPDSRKPSCGWSAV
jgi:hypothetical protein